MRWLIGGARFFRDEYFFRTCPLPDYLQPYRNIDGGGKIHWGYHIEKGFILLTTGGSEGAMRIYNPNTLQPEWARTVDMYVLGPSSYCSVKEILEYYHSVGSKWFWGGE